jgi:hypothetical protein
MYYVMHHTEHTNSSLYKLRVYNSLVPTPEETKPTSIIKVNQIILFQEITLGEKYGTQVHRCVIEIQFRNTSVCGNIIRHRAIND